MEPAEGVYVRYPRSKLLAVIAAEAARTGTTVVGEDLGTVPVEITEAMEEWTMLGLYAEQTRLGRCGAADDPGAHRCRAADPRHGAVRRSSTSAATSLTTGPSCSDRSAGESDRRESALLEGALTRLASSDAYLVAADLDDLLGETTPHNIPGKVLPTIWRRRLRQPTSETLADPTVRRLLAILTEEER